MTLASLLEVLKDNMDLMLTVLDGGVRVITFDAAGGTAISTELGSREVDRLGVESSDRFNIYLKDLPPEPEPEEPTDDNP